MRPLRRAVHGVLLLDKPVGMTSNHALQRAKRALRAEKAGHTGTLDPLASGLLPLCFGAATKFAQACLDADKHYRATLTLGERTASGDRETPVIERRAVRLDRTAIDAACGRFTGAIEQLPPMHSALKKDGRALYDYARAGVEVERTPRRVTIHRIDIVSWSGAELVLDIACSKGTYIRALADDIGQALGCGAHLAALRRTAAGRLDVRDAITPEALEALPESARDARLLPADRLLADWPAVRLLPEEAGRFLSGLRRRIDGADAAAVRVYGSEPDAFLGTAHIAAGELIADRLLSPLEVRATIATETR
ncbi:MAG: tRNA pseudouridine(55) synthase TruB [Ideonella sp.]|nr:tRNA pseudouridine(55) synthase TruB [Ideonella sp.]MCC7457953.1 tRNA pseudouridine(55) synthase TruB [Nitrospira sp.]